MLATLRHPNLPRVTDHFLIPGQGQYIVMDFVEGEDLGQRLKRLGPLPEADVLRWAHEVLEALAYLHRRKVIHRDIKPANIRITPEGEAMLVDFGIAKELDTEGGLTTTGARGLTPGFAPPEQYGSVAGQTDARSDIYSFGATLYTLLAGEAPADALSRLSRPSRYVPLSQSVPYLNRPLAVAIDRALEMEAAARFASAEEMKAALREEVKTLIETGPLPTPARSHLGRWVIVGTTALIIGLGTAIVIGIFAGPSNGNQQPTLIARPTVVLSIEGTQIQPQSLTPLPPTIEPSRTEGPTSTPFPPTATSTAIPTPLGGGSGQIAFWSDRDGNYEIYLMNADGSGLTRLTENPAEESDPDWSPDGAQIAFISDRDGNLEIYVMSADGSGLTRMTDRPSIDWWPDWSPDGAQIAFTSDREGNEEIYVMNADGSDQTRLTNSLYEDWQPTWSPDGAQIAFASGRDGPPEIYVMNVDGSGQTRLTNNGVRDYYLDWSPDGAQIAFTSDRDGNLEIYVMNADGSGLTRLTNDPANDFITDWSPDGAQIAFSSDRDGNWEIYVMNADGSGPTRLTNNPAADGDPVWGP